MLKLAKLLLLGRRIRLGVAVGAEYQVSIQYMHLCESPSYGTHVKICVISHHPLEANSNTLNDCEEDATHNGTVSRSAHTASYRQRTTGQETSDNSIVWILLLPYALDRAVVC